MGSADAVLLAQLAEREKAQGRLTAVVTSDAADTQRLMDEVAFFAPGLFRYFHEVYFEPAAFFALQVTRIPVKGVVTCQGGGYVGSGEVNPNRLPWPVLPRGLQYLPMEGAGEVQTPLRLPTGCPQLAVGDPVFFQHAKAGELCERFNQLYLLRGHKRIGTTPTYRGQGHAFL